MTTARQADVNLRYANNADNTRYADGAGCGLGRNSFTAGTSVQTDEGSKPIEAIQAGDKVFGEDPDTGEQGYYKVVSVRAHKQDVIVQVTIDAENGDEEVMEVTPDHPIYVEERGWIWAENLEVGDNLRTSDDSWAVVLDVEHVRFDEPELVYNFTVKGPHTYFVLDIRVLVHNDSNVCNPADYPHFTANLRQGGFTEDEGHEIISRLHNAGVSNDQLRLIDNTFADAVEVNVEGFDLMASLNDTSADFLVWRFADERHLDSNFSRLSSDEQQNLLDYHDHKVKAYSNFYDEEVTGLDDFLQTHAGGHAEGYKRAHARSPWISTGGQLGQIVNTQHAKGPASLLERTVTKSDTLYLLQIPEHKLYFGHINVTSETEILANAMRDSLHPHVVVGLPNIFRDKDFTYRLRQSLDSR